MCLNGRSCVETIPGFLSQTREGHLVLYFPGKNLADHVFKPGLVEQQWMY